VGVVYLTVGVVYLTVGMVYLTVGMVYLAVGVVYLAVGVVYLAADCHLANLVSPSSLMPSSGKILKNLSTEATSPELTALSNFE